ncbi:hypothetical protein TSH100_08100 [Azospirillum sp. TSH100]|uniref:hypothetical protein n=1 Tax=Azospirillum sp. TSH100 TaxID=652764 RepID=UPI000D61984B|nr:hypothetical protein [Azospirillum sp. TSH100]PWC88050.1 hypothetical protein TSH100_08100 [Azospirillum sp. TSH100]QCG92217.1 hypothetical protein E6C72_30995 [Azospirillum sp. TSH100]
MSAKSRLVINVEVDDRTVLFPDGKFLSHIALTEEGSAQDGAVRMEGVFLFNESRLAPEIATLPEEDARELARSILDAVFQGRTQHVLSETAKVAVVFNPNGFVLRFGEGDALRELFIGSPAIIRLAQGILRLVDRLSAQPAH